MGEKRVETITSMLWTEDETRLSLRTSRTDAPTAPAVDVKSAAMRYRETLLMALCLGHDAVGHELPHRANSVRVAGVSGNENHSPPAEGFKQGSLGRRDRGLRYFVVPDLCEVANR